MKSSLRHARLHLSSRTKPKNTYICIQCRINTQLHQFSTSGTNGAPQERARPIDFTERLRRRIWGTDTPPGPPPIYRKLSPEEEALAAAEFDELETENAIARDTATEVARQQEAGQYKPAEDWTGLEKIGGPKGWWEEAWDRENVYQGFLTEGVLERDELGDVGGMVRRVAVEIIALKQAGLPLYEGAKAKWLTEEFMEDIDIVRDDGGGFVLREHAPDIIDELLESLQKNEDKEELLDDEDDGEDEADEDDGAEAQDPEQKRILEELHAEEDAAAAELEMQEEAEEGEEIRTVATTKVHDPVYLELPLTDLAFKFALIKRLTYLTGTRISDPKISSFQTLDDVVQHLSEKPKPKKLAEILIAMPELTTLPNVEIHGKKRTFVDKETEIGRWKVIEAELRSRGLPVHKTSWPIR